MLRELHIRNLAVLAGAAVELGPGLNALTGETGAGKSIVVDSLALLAGARASSDLIRTGADTLTVSGLFEPAGDGWRQLLEESGLATDGGELLVRREVSRSGRNRVFVNDQPATLRLLSDLAPALLRIHGQREELGLVAPDLQREWLDRSGGSEADELLAATGEAHARWAQLAARLDRLTGDERARRERLDLLRFQAREIDAAGLLAGEEEGLRAERDVLRNLEAITHAFGTSLTLLFDEEGAAVERLAQGAALLGGVAGWEPLAGAWRDECEELKVRVEELALAVRGRLESIDAEPGRLDAVEERLAVVERLCRKYGGSSAEVLARRQGIETELAELEGDLEDREGLAARVAEALDAYRRAALDLSARRAAWGAALSERIAAELADLGLGRARFEVTLERRRRADSPLVVGGEAVELGPAGIDHVVFQLASNPGEAARPLARIASGGELSRIYLALQLAVRGEAEAAAPTLVFDEVDAGIGGAEAAALGKKLQRLARGGQILSVTHLPQVASHADLHFKVSKRVVGDRTHADVERLDPAGRVEEVARMLAGKKVTSLSRSHAEELITGAARGRR